MASFKISLYILLPTEGGFEFSIFMYAPAVGGFAMSFVNTCCNFAFNEAFWSVLSILSSYQLIHLHIWAPETGTSGKKAFSSSQKRNQCRLGKSTLDFFSTIS